MATGELYRGGPKGGHHNDDSRGILLRAARKGDKDAQFALAVIYLPDSSGLSGNPKMARKWMLAAAEMGHPRAQVTVARWFEGGHLFKRNKDLAAKWWIAAACQQRSEAFLNAGQCYEQGIGVTADKIQAALWYGESAKLWQPEGMEAFNKLVATFTEKEFKKLSETRREHMRRLESEAYKRFAQINGKEAEEEATRIIASRDLAMDEVSRRMFGQPAEWNVKEYRACDRLFRDLLMRGKIAGFNLKEHQAVIMKAVDSNDLTFFRKLGRLVRATPEGMSLTLKLQGWLAKNWVRQTDAPALCFFTDEALAELAQIALKLSASAASMQNVRKARQRLGLVQARNKTVKEVQLRDGKLLINDGPRSRSRATRRPVVGKSGAVGFEVLKPSSGE